MNCQEAKELFSDYLDQRLPQAWRSLFEEHIGGCSACRQELESLQRTISLVGSLEEIEPSADFLSRIHEKIDGRKSKKPVWIRLFEPLRVKVPLEVAALVLVGFTGLYLYQKLPELSQKPPVSPALESRARPQEKIQKEERDRESYRVAEDASSRKSKTQDSLSIPAEKGAAGTMAAAPTPEIQEIEVNNIAEYEGRVKSLLERVGGKLLVQEDIGSGVSMTVEIPQSRQAEFIAKLKEESPADSKVGESRREYSEDTKDIRPKEAEKGTVTLKKRDMEGDSPSREKGLSPLAEMITLELRILPKKY